MSRSVREIHNKYLRDPEFAAMYLNEALEEGNPVVIRMALRNIAEAQDANEDGSPAQTRPKYEAIEKLLTNASDADLMVLPEAILELGLKLKAEA